MSVNDELGCANLARSAEPSNLLLSKLDRMIEAIDAMNRNHSALERNRTKPPANNGGQGESTPAPFRKSPHRTDDAPSKEEASAAKDQAHVTSTHRTTQKSEKSEQALQPEKIFKQTPPIQHTTNAATQKDSIAVENSNIKLFKSFIYQGIILLGLSTVISLLINFYFFNTSHQVHST